MNKEKLLLLKAEIAFPAYLAMTDSEIVVELNALDKQRNKTTMTGSEIWTATDAGDYVALADIQKGSWLSVCGIEKHDPFGVSDQFVISVFGGGSSTVATLAALRVELSSTAIINGFGNVGQGDIEDARNI